MLIDVARQAVIDGINQNMGYSVSQSELPVGIRQSIEGLAIIQKNLYIMREVLNGERSRIQNNAIRSFISKHHVSKEMDNQASQIGDLQLEINNKITEICDRIRIQDSAPQRQVSIGSVTISTNKDINDKSSSSLLALKCPNCGAPLQMPSSQFVKCNYCKTTISIQDFGLQIKSMIQNL